MRIYTIHRRYDRQDAEVRAEIRALCAEVGGRFGPAGVRAIFEYLTTDAGFLQTCQRYGLSERALQEMRRDFYAIFRL